MPANSRRTPQRTKGMAVGGTLTVLFFTILLVFFRLITGGGADPLPTLPAGSSSDWVSVAFTDPHAAYAKTLRGGPDQALADAIDAARLSVDVAAYDFDLWSLRDALIAAERRGVKVQLVTDSDYLDNPEVQALKQAGIPVLGDRRESLMHNKFMVIDRLEVWTGSMNFTVNGAYRNNNNLIRIRSSRLAEDYTAEFNEMFQDDLFGSLKAPGTLYPSVTIEGVQVEVFFSPEDDTVDRLVTLISSARKSVHFLAYSFTSDPIAAAMETAAGKGVEVRGVFEASQVESNQGGEYQALLADNLDVRLDGNPRNMHHKVIILDNQIVVTGSYNFSANAENSNDENLLIIHSPELAAQYQAEFERVYSEAQP